MNSYEKISLKGLGHVQKTVYEDNKYCMQDVGNIYIGAKYTLEEILEAEDILFKFRLVMERYILPESDRQDTLETQLYYLQETQFCAQIYKQLKARVKISIIEEKKSLLTGKKSQYTTRVIPIDELIRISVTEKEKKGVVIQELVVSKMALMMF